MFANSDASQCELRLEPEKKPRMLALSLFPPFPMKVIGESTVTLTSKTPRLQ
jgi:hypothetical protein